MALLRNSYTIAADVLVAFTAAASRDRISVPSLASYLLRGYVDGTIALVHPLRDGGSATRTPKDLALDEDLLREAAAKAAEDGLVSTSRLLEVLFAGCNRGEITLTASGRVGAAPDET